MSVCIYKCRSGFINVGADLQMLVRIYKSRVSVLINVTADL